MKNWGQRGFALLEFVFSSLTSISLVVFFLSLCYTSLARLWLGQATYDAVICLSQGQANTECEKKLTAKAKWIGAQPESIELQAQSRHWRVNVDWKLLKGIEFSTQSKLNQKAFY